MSSTQGFPAIAGAGSAAQKESAVVFDLEMRSSWGQGLPLRVRSDFNINDVREEIAKKYAWAPKNFRLLFNGNIATRLELPDAHGKDPNAVSATICLVRLAGDPSGLLHPFEE
jgi:hypothetical protein